MWFCCIQRRPRVFLVSLNCSLHCIIGPVIHSPLLLQEREDNSAENHSKVVLREYSQKSVESPVHQQDKNGGASSRQGGVKGFSNLYWKMRDCEAGEELSDGNIVSKQGNGLGEGGIIPVQGQGNDLFIEHWISEYIGQENFPLGNREVEDMDGGLIGWGVEDRGHLWTGKIMLGGMPYILTTQYYPSRCWTASACPSSPGQSFVIPRQ